MASTTSCRLFLNINHKTSLSQTVKNTTTVSWAQNRIFEIISKPTGKHEQAFRLEQQLSSVEWRRLDEMHRLLSINWCITPSAGASDSSNRSTAILRARIYLDRTEPARKTKQVRSQYGSRDMKPHQARTLKKRSTKANQETSLINYTRKSIKTAGSDAMSTHPDGDKIPASSRFSRKMQTRSASLDVPVPSTLVVA